ncbi:MAG: heat-inducible transcriptional repressor HrcA [Alphaproteobacteria bacterium]|nr:MAG: heat-inducible transcriptional repressor HrcA [Alphaproteobacteria bacterium]
MRLEELNERSRQVFRQIVETYLETGEPVGSRTLSRLLTVGLSPATIRNVMADLEDAGLLYAPHTSAGRMPTETGLRIFVDGLLEVGDLTEEERRNIEAQCRNAGQRLEDVLSKATNALSDLSQCAGMVLVPKTDSPLKHIEFVALRPGRALVVVVTEDGAVENRLMEVPLGLPPSALVTASNYLNAHLQGKTLSEIRAEIKAEQEKMRAELDALSREVVSSGLAVWTNDERDDAGALIVRGRANLLGSVEEQMDLERIRQLFEDLETKKDLIRLLDLAREAQGVRIFIGSENKLFSLSGSSVIVSPFTDARDKIVGAIGVIGPTRLNYARIIPMVDYTARLIGRYLHN